MSKPENKIQSLQRYLKVRESALAEWAQGVVEPASLIRFALLDYAQSDKLQRCSPASIYQSLIAAAQLGLEPSSTRGEGAIVPYGGIAQFQPMYRGLCKLARRDGPVKAIYAHVVYEGDHFRAWLGTECRIEHELSVRDRGNPIAAYAVARIEDDEPMYEVMPWSDVLKIKALAKGSQAWKSWEDQMARKSAIKRLCKTLPVGEAFAKAVAIDNAIETGDRAQYNRVIDVEVEEPEIDAEVSDDTPEAA